jgi:hypothetical protein
MTADDAFALLRSLPSDWGASDAEIGQVEAALGVRLPDPLRVVMQATGKGMHLQWLFPDGAIAPLAELPGLLREAREILAGDPSSLHPVGPIVVLSEHQGYEFSFIRANAPDPEVMSYCEGRGVRPGLGRQTIRQMIAAAVLRSIPQPRA